MTLAQAEAAYLRETLEANGWNVKRSAIQAGICRSSLYWLMHKHGIERPQPSPMANRGTDAWQALA